MDGLLLMGQENAFKYVHQLLHFSVILIPSDVLINVLKEDISLLQTLKDLVVHIALLHIWGTYTLIILHGLV